MSTHVTLTTAKQHLQVDHAGDDGYIQDLLDMVENRILGMFYDCGYTAAEVTAILADARKKSRIRSAILFQLADDYTHRDGRATSEKIGDAGYGLGEINYKVHELIVPMLKVNI